MKELKIIYEWLVSEVLPAAEFGLLLKHSARHLLKELNDTFKCLNLRYLFSGQASRA